MRLKKKRVSVNHRSRVCDSAALVTQGLLSSCCAGFGMPVMRGQIEDNLNSEIYKCFAREGIEIPYPKQDVYVRHVPSSTQAQG